MRFFEEKLLVIFILLLVVFFALVDAEVFGSETPVAFPDPNLEQAIRDAIDKPAGDIHQSDLLGLTELHAYRREISDLTGLEHCTGITNLYLYDNQLRDISPLAGLTNLTWLYLLANQISDISALAGLTNLMCLDLALNQISGISALAGLTNLTQLYLDGNQISDISPLAGLTNLRWLHLEDNQIATIQALVDNRGLLGANDGIALRRNYLDLSSGSDDMQDIQKLVDRGVQVIYTPQNELHEVIHFPDPNLEQAIRDAIGKPTGDIYQSELLGLKELHANEREIVDLSGLEHCTGLTNLYLRKNQISDLSPLAGLNNLTWLDLENNQISDINLLAGLTNLTWLCLRWNQISDLSPLAGLMNLTVLELYDYQISDISPLIGLTNLTRLYLGGTQVSDLSPLAGLTNLTKLNLHLSEISDLSPLARLTNLTGLDLNNNRITDLSPLAGLINLTVLTLYGNHITDISALAGLTNLTELQLSYNQISDISLLAGLTNLRELYLDLEGIQISDLSPLAELTNLTALYLSSSQITDVRPLATLTELRRLSLRDNRIADLSPLAGLINLTVLKLSSNEISDFSPLAELTNLTRLYMGRNRISDTSSLARLTNLTTLILSVNEISDLSPLARLANLTELDLSSNEISDLSALAGLTNLTELYLEENQISNISPLARLTNLSWLSLGYNQITSLQTLVDNPGLGADDEIGLQNNYLDLSSGSDDMEDIQKLVDRGVEVTYTPQKESHEVVHFPDPNLEQAIRDAIDKPIGDIYQSDLLGLTELYANEREIVDLTGLEHCTGLTTLGLRNNQISDLRPLAGLTNLTELNLGRNQISDIRPLARLTNLTKLSLDWNEISDLRPLAGLTNLTKLSLNWTEITDLSPLAGLTNLTEVSLGRNQISDISPLAALTNLTWLSLVRNQISDIAPLAALTNLTWLFLSNNKISDISPLAGLTNLTWLWLQDTQISDISPLTRLTKLTKLYLRSNQIGDLSPLAGLTNLTELRLGENQIGDLSPLAGLTNLTELYLGGNQINDISPLAKLSNLTILSLDSNQISGLSPLAELTNLTWLYLDGNQISDLSPLAGLTNLTRLYLGDNQISDIRPLAGLTNLTKLYLGDNQISDIGPLAKLTNLWGLWLEANQISDLSPLAGLTNLTYLDLEGNQINHIEALVDNSGLGANDWISLEYNNLDLSSGSGDMKDIQKLVDRGAQVTYKPQNTVHFPDQPRVSISPESITTSIGGRAEYNITVKNPNDIPIAPDLSLEGLPSAWYTLSKESLTLTASEEEEITLSITVPESPDNSGDYEFKVVAGSTATSAVLNVVIEPIIYGLSPLDNITLSSNSIACSWKTSVDSSTELYIRAKDETDFTRLQGESGLEHSIMSEELPRNKDYVWHVKTCTEFGCAVSENRSFHIDNGIVFTQDEYVFNVKREYDQHFQVGVTNADDEPHNLLVKANSPYKDLFLGFVGEGSIDKEITLNPGEARTIAFVMHAQDAKHKAYTFPITLTSHDAENITDYALVHINIIWPNIDFDIREISTDPMTLVKTYRVTNNGDSLTDFRVLLDDAIKNEVYLEPQINHYYFRAGQSIEFKAIPLFSEDHCSIKGTVTAEAAGVSKTIPVSFECPEGTELFQGHIDHPLYVTEIQDWYCINNPEIDADFSLPSGFEADDVIYAKLFIDFSLPWRRSSYAPHNVFIKVNGEEIGRLMNTIPEGRYTFSIASSALNYANIGKAENRIHIHTEYPSYAHFVSNTHMRVQICLEELERWVCAVNQEEANASLWEIPGIEKPPSTIDVQILSPSEGSNVTVDQPTLIEASVTGDYGPILYTNVTASVSNTDLTVELKDDGIHNDGEAGDGVYANTWTPDKIESYEITVSVTDCVAGGSDSVMVSVKPKPDLAITGIDISPKYGDRLIKGEEATVKISVENVGSVPIDGEEWLIHVWFLDTPEAGRVDSYPVETTGLNHLLKEYTIPVGYLEQGQIKTLPLNVQLRTGESYLYEDPTQLHFWTKSGSPSFNFADTLLAFVDWDSPDQEKANNQKTQKIQVHIDVSADFLDCASAIIDAVMLHALGGKKLTLQEALTLETLKNAGFTAVQLINELEGNRDPSEIGRLIAQIIAPLAQKVVNASDPVRFAFGIIVDFVNGARACAELVVEIARAAIAELIEIFFWQPL